MSEFPELVEFAKENRNEIVNTDYGDSCLFIRLFNLIDKIATLRRNSNTWEERLLRIDRYKIRTVNALRTQTMVKNITIYNKSDDNICNLGLLDNKITLKPMYRDPAGGNSGTMPKGFNFMEELRLGRPGHPIIRIEEETPLYKILSFDISSVKSARN